MRSAFVQKACLRLVGMVGAAVFSTSFALTYSVPEWVETYAADFIENEVRAEVSSRIDDFEVSAGDSAASQLAAALYRQNLREIERLKEALKAGVHESMATALAEIRDLDCECRDKYAQVFERTLQSDIELLQGANDRIVEFIQTTYMEVVAALKRDIRVFTGANAGVFLLLVLVSFMKPNAIGQLFVPAVLLTIATLINAYLYVVEQNWLLTIIYGDYWGFLYLLYLGLVFLALCDVILNRARVTTAIANAALETVGAAATLTPC
jgi:hypothetical protein